ncbi:MAG: hypothetical protein AAGE96_21310 [Cyanobacteria bacterium P01_G01_bin.19]
MAKIVLRKKKRDSFEALTSWWELRSLDGDLGFTGGVSSNYRSETYGTFSLKLAERTITSAAR